MCKEAFPVKKDKPILQILANRHGVYEVAFRALVDEYQVADRLSAAIRPAIAIIDQAIREVYGRPSDATQAGAKPTTSSQRSTHGSSLGVRGEDTTYE